MLAVSARWRTAIRMLADRRLPGPGGASLETGPPEPVALRRFLNLRPCPPLCKELCRGQWCAITD